MKTKDYKTFRFQNGFSLSRIYGDWHVIDRHNQRVHSGTERTGRAWLKTRGIEQI